MTFREERIGNQRLILIDPDYFEIACRRVDEAARQPDLFIEAAPKPTQEAMDLRSRRGRNERDKDMRLSRLWKQVEPR